MYVDTQVLVILCGTRWEVHEVINLKFADFWLKIWKSSAERSKSTETEMVSWKLRKMTTHILYNPPKEITYMVQTVTENFLSLRKVVSRLCRLYMFVRLPRRSWNCNLLNATGHLTGPRRRNEKLYKVSFSSHLVRSRSFPRIRSFFSLGITFPQKLWATDVASSASDLFSRWRLRSGVVFNTPPEECVTTPPSLFWKVV